MKKKFLLLFLIIGCFCFCANVYADEINEGQEGPLCSLETKNNLRIDAANVTINYQPVEVSDSYGTDDAGNHYEVSSYYFDIKIYNINSKLNVIVSSSDGGAEKELILSYKNIGTDGAITIRKKASTELSNLVFEIRGSNSTGDCALETLRTMRLTLPKYNSLAEREICSDIPEFYMCQKYINFDIKPENFSKEVKKYKEKKEKENNSSNVEVENNNSVTSKAADLINKNKYFIVGAILLTGVIVTVIIIKRKKRVL